MNTSYAQYLYEKSILEAYGYSSIITYEEWVNIKINNLI